MTEQTTKPARPAAPKRAKAPKVAAPAAPAATSVAVEAAADPMPTPVVEVPVAEPAEAVKTKGGDKKKKKKEKKAKKAKKEAVIIRFEDAQLATLDAQAESLGLSRAAWVRMVVAKALAAE